MNQDLVNAEQNSSDAALGNSAEADAVACLRLEVIKADLGRNARPWYNTDIIFLLSLIVHWQPIETAPKDGTRILVYASDGKIARGYWHDDLREFPERHDDVDECEHTHCGRNHERRLNTWVADGVTAHPPTHWMPLPAPPNTQA